MTEQTFKINGRTYVATRSIRDGWSVVSQQTGKEYSLLEGMSLGGTSTSDICFIMESNENGYVRLINYTFGAEELEYSIGYIDDYETGKTVPMQKNSLVD